MIDLSRERIVSLDDVARMAGVVKATVQNWAKRKRGRRLETTKLGGKVVTTLEAFQRFGVHNDSEPESRKRTLGNQDRAAATRRRIREKFGI